MMTIEEFIADYGSTTECFQRISDNYRLEVLKQWQQDGNFHRLVAIYVDERLVMLGLSSTNLATSPLFANILLNSGTTPIGTRLFAKDSAIIRSHMKNSVITSSAIEHKLVKYYLDQHLSDESNCLLHYRQSSFVYATQSLRLDEYFLPTLADLLLAVN